MRSIFTIVSVGEGRKNSLEPASAKAAANSGVITERFADAARCSPPASTTEACQVKADLRRLTGSGACTEALACVFAVGFSCKNHDKAEPRESAGEHKHGSEGILQL